MGIPQSTETTTEATTAKETRNTPKASTKEAGIPFRNRFTHTPTDALEQGLKDCPDDLEPLVFLTVGSICPVHRQHVHIQVNLKKLLCYMFCFGFGFDFVESRSVLVFLEGVG